ncbi:MAG: D-alanyl-D-alanine carboxypeptidase family protein [Firmicutes bacterium]|nr:D-alanyl-D-alanine carboxypeptidase family protein [Bacillota bacterium]
MKYKIYIIIFLLFFILKSDDKDFYTDIKNIENPNNYLVLVNKNNKLDKYYVPKDLETISNKFSYDNKKLRKVAKEAFEKLSYDASLFGYRIIATSAYRDYNYQSNLFNNYVKEKGIEYALMCSAKEGHSEHQTGLAIDVEGSNLDYDDFENSKEFNWMITNAHKYGFILRYPKGKEDITGFKYEPWHYRYVGIDEATYIYNNKITLEEYIQKK